MKLKEFFHLLGLKPRARTFGVEVLAFDLPKDGRIEVAQWLAPRARRMIVTQELVDELRTFLHPGDLAIDIGAHMGDTTLPMALAVGPTGAVLALEPNPYLFPALERNAALNTDRTRIIPLCIAAMPTAGEYDFHYQGPEYYNGGYHEGMSRWRHVSAFTVKVRGENLTELLRTAYAERLLRLRFIKVDVEGFDLAVLKTLEPVIREFRPYLQVEVLRAKVAGPGYRESLTAYLEGLGYELRKVEPTTLTRGPLVDAAMLGQGNTFDVFCSPH